jgi:lycopene cyclase domain-containing protein
VFENYTYLGYTLVFCVPAILVLWLRAEFARTMRKDLPGILLATAILTVYGSAIWPLAIRWGCWSYHETRILNLRLFGFVDVEDVVWWLLVSFLFASFVSLSTRYRDSGRDVVLLALRGLSRAVGSALAGAHIAARLRGADRQ